MASAYLPALVLAMSIVMITATLFGLNQALLRTSWPDPRRVRVLRIAAALLIGWLAVALTLALVGLSEAARGWPPTIQLGLVTLVAIAMFLLWQARRSPTGRV